MSYDLAATTPAMKPAISVSELNRQARLLLERSFITVQVEGEISNFVRPSSGHWYFTLKDDKAQVRCAMFKNKNMHLKPPKQGDQVVVRAKVSLYEGRGDYQLICESMDSGGSGSLQAAFDALKLKLQQEGLFDSAHKKPLPQHPKHIGVVTSATGAAIHDILTVLKRRFPGLPVTLYPTAVQGEEAPAQISKAIILAEAHQQCDVLIIGRGGGSLEDLWAFNSEQVARTLFDCALPTVSAVGHEVDFVITDFVADIRAATPSAAAELLSPDQQLLQQKLTLQEGRLTHLITHTLQKHAERIRHISHRLRHPGQQLREQAQRLDHLEMRLQNAIRQRINQKTQHLTQLSLRHSSHSPQQLVQRQQAQLSSLLMRLKYAQHSQLQQARLNLRGLIAQLNVVSPLATLERGYSITKDQSGAVLRDASNEKVGNLIETQLHKGSLRCRVEQILTE